MGLKDKKIAYIYIYIYKIKFSNNKKVSVTS